jgi:ribosomal protein S12 methylthiotransferase
VKISEGCNHRCSFCIIPSMRGDLASRPANAVLREAEKLVEAGTKELLIISQDTSAYGVDIKHAESKWRDTMVRAHVMDLSRALGDLGVWVRLHYIYPYPHVDNVIPLMAEGKILPYLDIVLRSTFIVGFPGETEADFEHLMEWLQEAQLDRIGCFKFEPVKGATANDLPDAVPEDIKQARWDRFMETAQHISAAKLQKKVGTQIDVIVDEVGGGGATGRSKADAPEIDGQVHLRDVVNLHPGDIVKATVEESDDYDLFGVETALSA